MAAADAAIGCWNDNYHWNFWRPITAIREAATDGNPDTTADTEWLPLFDPSTLPGLVTPPFPDHPSGHNCAAGAIVRTLQDFFGTDRIAFSAHSDRSGTTRTFHRLSDAPASHHGLRTPAPAATRGPAARRVDALGLAIRPVRGRVRLSGGRRLVPGRLESAGCSV
jgi:hypothetical protein